MSQSLAYAFLALADDDTLPDQRTLPRVLVAAVAAVVLALSVPLGFFTLRPSEHPVAALSSNKVSLMLDDEGAA
jgi:hypothetical protein